MKVLTYSWLDARSLSDEDLPHALFHLFGNGKIGIPQCWRCTKHGSLSPANLESPALIINEVTVFRVSNARNAIVHKT